MVLSLLSGFLTQVSTCFPGKQVSRCIQWISSVKHSTYCPSVKYLKFTVCRCFPKVSQNIVKCEFQVPGNGFSTSPQIVCKTLQTSNSAAWTVNFALRISKSRQEVKFSTFALVKLQNSLHLQDTLKFLVCILLSKKLTFHVPDSGFWVYNDSHAASQK